MITNKYVPELTGKDKLLYTMYLRGLVTDIYLIDYVYKEMCKKIFPFMKDDK
jgi:hypothetical protein